MRLIDADALIKQTTEYRCVNCDRRKGMKNGKLTFVYDIGEVPCRACDVGDMIDTLDEAPTIGGWISVKDSTPTVMHLDCWVMIKDCPNPVIDYWEGDRGEESTGVFPDGEKTFVKSGWYYNDCNEVTHWMPIPRPEPPEEVTGDD